MNKHLLIATLVAALAVGGTVSAQVVRPLNLAAYPDGTLVSEVNEPGFTLTAGTPGNVTVQAGKLEVVGDGSSADLTIVFTRGATSSTFAYNGLGTCQVQGFDVFSRQQEAEVVDTFTSRAADVGRCHQGTNTKAIAHDRLVVNVSQGRAPPDIEVLSDISYIEAAQPTPVPTMAEWAMILFGMILAGGAALFIQRRRLCV